jgi:hypothetical protein
MSNHRQKSPNLIHRNDILNGLLAIHAAFGNRNMGDAGDTFEEGYQTGFESALVAVAQMFGQTEIFLTEKSRLKNNSLKGT